MKFGRIILLVNMRQVEESDFRYFCHAFKMVATTLFHVCPPLTVAYAAVFTGCQLALLIGLPWVPDRVAYRVPGYQTHTWILLGLQWVLPEYSLLVGTHEQYMPVAGVIMTRILWVPKWCTFHYPDLQSFVTQMKFSLIEYLF